MKELMKRIGHIMATDGRSIEGRALKTSEETGELSEAVLSFTGAPGCEYKMKTVDDVISEVADVVICALSVGLHADPELSYHKLTHVIDLKMHKWHKVVEQGRIIKLAEEDAERGMTGTYYMLWIQEEDKWYYFKDDYDASVFKTGYVEYAVVVKDGIIWSDSYKHSAVGKPFSSAYQIKNWEVK